jgi:hypothetical protein
MAEGSFARLLQRYTQSSSSGSNTVVSELDYERPFQLAEDQYIDRVAGQLREDGRGVVGFVDGVPVAVELADEERALPMVCAAIRSVCCVAGWVSCRGWIAWPEGFPG